MMQQDVVEAGSVAAQVVEEQERSSGESDEEGNFTLAPIWTRSNGSNPSNHSSSL